MRKNVSVFVSKTLARRVGRDRESTRYPSPTPAVEI